MKKQLIFLFLAVATLAFADENPTHLKVTTTGGSQSYELSKAPEILFDEDGKVSVLSTTVSNDYAAPVTGQMITLDQLSNIEFVNQSGSTAASAPCLYVYLTDGSRIEVKPSEFAFNGATTTNVSLNRSTTRLMDIRFGQNGSASDACSHAVTPYGDASVEGLDFNPKFCTEPVAAFGTGAYVARFDNRWHEDNALLNSAAPHLSLQGTKPVHYAVNCAGGSHADASAFYNDVKDAVVVEAVVMVDRNTPVGGNPEQTDIVSCRQDGGFALTVDDSDGTNRFGFQIGCQEGTGVNYQTALSTFDIERGKYYHLVGSYKKGEKARLWVFDGTSTVATESATLLNESIKQPAADVIQIGGKPSALGAAETEHGFRGAVAMVRVYSGEVGDAEVTAMQQAVVSQLQAVNSIIGGSTLLPDMIADLNAEGRISNISMGGSGWQAGDKVIIKDLATDKESTLSIDATTSKVALVPADRIATGWHRFYAKRGSMLDYLGLSHITRAEDADAAPSLLFDLQVNRDGSAHDTAPGQHAVTALGTDFDEAPGGVNPKFTTRWSDAFGCYVTRFDNRWSEEQGSPNHGQVGISPSACYKVDFKGKDFPNKGDFYNATKGSLLLETIVMADCNFPTISGYMESSIIANHQKGNEKGFTLFAMPNGSENILVFAVHTAGGWRQAKAQVPLERGKYYHVVASYDKGLGKARIWTYDGVDDCYGEVTTDGTDITETMSDWFAIGGNANKGVADECFRGDIVMARVYGGGVVDGEDFVARSRRAVRDQLRAANYSRLILSRTTLPDQIDNLNANGASTRVNLGDCDSGYWLPGDEVVAVSVAGGTEYRYAVEGETGARASISIPDSDLMPTDWYRFYALRGDKREYIGLTSITRAATATAAVTPPALLMDLKFNSNGTATDISSWCHETVAPNLRKGYRQFNYWSEELGCYATRFDNEWFGSNAATFPGHYRVNIAGNGDGHSKADFNTAYKTGVVTEAIVMVDRNKENTGYTESEIISSNGGSNGFTLHMQQNKGVRFSVRCNDTWRHVTGPELKHGTYYHVIGAYDNTGRRARMWVFDGTNTVEVTGDAGASDIADIATDCLGIGANITSAGGNVQSYFRGDIAMARVYGGVIDDNFVARRQAEIQTRLAAVNRTRFIKENTTLPDDVTGFNLGSADGMIDFGDCGFTSDDNVAVQSLESDFEKEYAVSGNRISVPASDGLDTGWYRFYGVRDGERDYLGLTHITSALPQSQQKIGRLLLDVAFDENANASDLSPLQMRVTKRVGTTGFDTDPKNHPVSYWDEAFQRWAVSLCNTPSAEYAEAYYDVDLRDPDGNDPTVGNTNAAAFRDGIGDNKELNSSNAYLPNDMTGHAIECIFTMRTDRTFNNEELQGTVFGCLGGDKTGGGHGILTTFFEGEEASHAPDISFLNTVTVHDPATSKKTYRYANSGIVPVENRYYHVIGVLDPDKRMSRVYVNGRLRGETHAPTGTFRLPREERTIDNEGIEEKTVVDLTDRWYYAIGADAKTAVGTAENGWCGNIVSARVYNKTLSADEVAERWAAVESQINSAPVPIVADVHYATKTADVTDGIFSFTGTGWQSGDKIQFRSQDESVQGEATVERIEGDRAFIHLPDALQTETYKMYLIRDNAEAFSPAGQSLGYTYCKEQYLGAHYFNFPADTDAAETLSSRDGFYQIYNLTDLKNYARILSTVDNTACAILMNDIDCGNEQLRFGKSGWNDKFDGEFDGNGHTLTVNLSIPDGDYPLFGDVGYKGVVRNLHLSGTIQTSKNYVGSIAGANYGLITNCWSDITISSTRQGDSCTGGLVGAFNGGAIVNSMYCGTIDCNNKASNIGGLTGWVHDDYLRSTMRNCLAAADFRNLNGSGYSAVSRHSVKIANGSDVPERLYAHNYYVKRNSSVTGDDSNKAVESVLGMPDAAGKYPKAAVAKLCFQLNAGMEKPQWGIPASEVNNDYVSLPTPDMQLRADRVTAYASVATDCNGAGTDYYTTYTFGGSDKGQKHHLVAGRCTHCGYFDYDAVERGTDGYYKLRTPEDVRWSDWHRYYMTDYVYARMENDIDMDPQTNPSISNELPTSYFVYPEGNFRGDFDGGSHTLNVNLKNSLPKSSTSKGFMAQPFEKASNGLMEDFNGTLRNIALTGKITLDNPKRDGTRDDIYAGIIAHRSGNTNAATLDKVACFVEMDATPMTKQQIYNETGANRDLCMGGLFGISHQNATTVSNSVFAGKVHCGEFYYSGVTGWVAHIGNGATVRLQNVLLVPESVDVNDYSGIRPNVNYKYICRSSESIDDDVSLSNVHYVKNIMVAGSSLPVDAETRSENNADYHEVAAGTKPTGELCWTVNGESSESPVFFQKLTDPSRDLVPMPWGEDVVYYRRATCNPSDENYVYANDEEADHNYVAGTCTVCGGDGPAEPQQLPPLDLEMSDDGFYLVYTAEDLMKVAEYINTNAPENHSVAGWFTAGNGIPEVDVRRTRFRLMADIDFAEINAENGGWTPWTPIGDYRILDQNHAADSKYGDFANAKTHCLDPTNSDSSNRYDGPTHEHCVAFVGEFDGQYHAIKNLRYKYDGVPQKHAAGLFGHVGPGAKLRNFHMDETCYFEGNVQFFGAVAGIAGGDGTVSFTGVGSDATIVSTGTLTNGGFSVAQLMADCNSKMENDDDVNQNGALDGMHNTYMKATFDHCWAAGKIYVHRDDVSASAFSGWLGRTGSWLKNCWATTEIYVKSGDNYERYAKRLDSDFYLAGYMLSEWSYLTDWQTGKKVYIDGSCSMVDCYANSGNFGTILKDKHGTTAKNEHARYNGLVAYLANGDQSSVEWRQNCYTGDGRELDKYPTTNPNSLQVMSDDHPCRIPGELGYTTYMPKVRLHESFLPENVAAYKLDVKQYHHVGPFGPGNYFIPSKVENLEAYEPVMLAAKTLTRGVNDVALDIYGNVDDDPAPGYPTVDGLDVGTTLYKSGYLYGVAKKVSAPDNAADIDLKDGIVAFHNVDEDHKIEPYHGFVMSDSKEPTYIFLDDGEESYWTTVEQLEEQEGGEGITDADSKTGIYNIYGIRLNKLQKGINIVNGKKVFIP